MEMERHKPMNLLLPLLARGVKLGWLDSAAWTDTSSRAMKMDPSASTTQRAANSTIESLICTKRKSWICNSAPTERTLSPLQETRPQRYACVDEEASHAVSDSDPFLVQLIDADSLEVIKQYTTATPLNSAAILPGKPYVSERQGIFPDVAPSILPYLSSQILLGGGQDAMNVTTTGARQGQFEIRFWHK